MNWGYGQGSVAQTDGQGTSDETRPPARQVKPDTDIDELFERQRQYREEGKRRRFDYLATRFVDKFGYNPKDYVFWLKEGGTNVSVHSASFWYKFRVKPVEGLIEVQHQTVTRNKISKLLEYHNDVTLAVKFTLEPEMCRKFSDDNNCIFVGQNFVQLPSFMARHQILKDGIWEVTYIKSGQEMTSRFRIFPHVLPEGTYEGVTMNEINTYICRSFPDDLSCQSEF